MSQQSYLIFELNNASYGIPTIAVQDFFGLPEVTPTVETAPNVIGIINLRGNILPIVDLSRLLGQSPLPLQPTDGVIVVQWQDQRVGMIVHQVCEVQQIASDNIQTHLAYQRTSDNAVIPITLGIVTLESTLVTLINPAYVIQAIVAGKQDSSHANGNGVTTTYQKQALYSHLPLEVQHQLQSRSHSLSQKFRFQDETRLISIAVLQLEGEFFGVGLDLVHELINIHKFTLIPCCPMHIIGNMNLRGEIITLIDISHILNLPRQPSKNRQKAILVDWNHSNIGIAVDDIVDVTELDPQQILPAPIAISSSTNEYVQGVVAYQDEMISMINLPKVLMASSLVVNEDI